MPANLTPEYLEAEEKYRRATTPQEKLAALEEMLATIPKHKGTEKMQADIKRRISKLKKELQRKKKSGAARKPFYHVEREGAGQVVLAGPPNVGKSQLVARLTSATPEVAEYPFTTRLPVPGMMEFENVKIQLVDLPPLWREFSEPWLFGLIRNAHAVLLVVDASDDDVLTQTETSLSLLEEKNIQLVPPTFDDAGMGKRALLVANKLDLPRARENVHILEEFFGQRLPVVPVSAATGLHLERLKREIYRALGVIRVYTKAPGKPVDRTAPFVLKRGSTVLDAARAVHHDFAEKLKYARIWGSERFDGQKVSRDHVLEDEDVVEFHI
ncbi:MAG: TGS domain-containing protein [Acidobacteria bacterium]|nr:MAG: TGS domain-containing protein [Acidobacteriota bacterium]